jgi:hypothetical protein
MMRLKCLVAACVLTLMAGQANADVVTFTADGTYRLSNPTNSPISGFGGSITVDGNTGLVTSAFFSFAGEQFNNIIDQGPAGRLYDVTVLTPQFNQGRASGAFCDANPTIYHNGFRLNLFDDPATLVANNGGLIASFSGATLFDCFCSADVVSGQLIGPPRHTPASAALPLFATGLGALGLLGWRRERRAAFWLTLMRWLKTTGQSSLRPAVLGTRPIRSTAVQPSNEIRPTSDTELSENGARRTIGAEVTLGTVAIAAPMAMGSR